jgi:hypothetical protein
MRFVLSLLFLSVFITSVVYAGKKHVHHEADLTLSVVQDQIRLELRAPSGSIYGFERVAKTPQEIEKRDTAAKAVVDRLPEWLLFANPQSCAITKQEVNPFEGGGGHGDFVARMDLKCQSNLSGSKVELRLYEVFPAVHRVQVSLNAESEGKLTQQSLVGRKVPLVISIP